MNPSRERISKQTNALVPTAHLLFTDIFTQALLGSMAVNNKCPIKKWGICLFWRRVR
ncbi:MAG: hypothetical protein RL632_513, partial [Bacteroidota bacterium]